MISRLFFCYSICQFRLLVNKQLSFVMVAWFNFHRTLKYHVKWKQVETAVESQQACGRVAKAGTA